MRTEIGIVIQKEYGKVLVEADPDASCTTCEAKHGCMMSNETKKRNIWLDTTKEIEIGDKVSFTIEEKAMVFSSFLLYILPILFLITGVAIPHYVLKIKEEGILAISGTFGLLLSFVVIKLISIKIQTKSMFVPKLLDVIAKKNEG